MRALMSLTGLISAARRQQGEPRSASADVGPARWPSDCGSLVDAGRRAAALVMRRRRLHKAGRGQRLECAGASGASNDRTETNHRAI
jgi:hypothetical protein